MNLMGAVLVHLWVAGWAFAVVRASLKARAAEVAASSRAAAFPDSGITNR